MATSKSPAPLRFAALIRVSTEGQAKSVKESLRVQHDQIEEAVQRMSGKIVEWYGGAEHGTPGYEKQEITRLLSDCSRKKFNAFICSHPDRWSRDNDQSSDGLKIFRDAQIRFFILNDEQDLFDDNNVLFLDISAAIGKYFARTQRKKSMDARIHKAQRGCCTCGRKPYGRIWNKETETWSVDVEKQLQIEDIVKRYLAGESLVELAKELGMKHANIYELLRERLGDTWTQTFYPNKRSKTDKGDPVVTTIKIPPLLPEETIQAIRAKLQANKTVSHGSQKYEYLLSRMVFCSHCGTSLSGQTNHHITRYHRHMGPKALAVLGKPPCQHPHTFIPADEIEELVLLRLFETFRNPKAVKDAVERASGDTEKVKEHEQRIVRVVAELEKISRGRKRILDLIADEKISQDDAAGKLQDLKERESKLNDEQSRLADFLTGRPSREQIKDTAEKVSAAFGKYRRGSWKVPQARMTADAKPFDEMSWEEKRWLVESVFSGKTTDGKRMGVYVTWSEDGKDWTFAIHGHLIDLESARWSESLKRSVKEGLEEGIGGHKQRELLSKVSKSASY